MDHRSLMNAFVKILRYSRTDSVTIYKVRNCCLTDNEFFCHKSQQLTHRTSLKARKKMCVAVVSMDFKARWQTVLDVLSNLFWSIQNYLDGTVSSIKKTDVNAIGRSVHKSHDSPHVVVRELRFTASRRANKNTYVLHHAYADETAQNASLALRSVETAIL